MTIDSIRYEPESMDALSLKEKEKTKKKRDKYKRNDN